MAKKYTWGLYCGRLQHIHIGHQQIIDLMINECEHGLILIGSAQESGTMRNPFTYELRKTLVQTLYKDAIVRPLPDMTSERDITPEWGRYVLRHAVAATGGASINAMYYGNDEERDGWFDPADIAGIDMIVFDRAVIPISATEMRSYLASGDFDAWSRFSDTRIHEYFKELRQELRNVPV